MLYLTLCILLAFEGSSEDDLILSYKAEMGVKWMTYTIHESQLESIPDWSPEEECPPLSPRKAINIGTNGLKVLEKRGFIKRYHELGNWEMVEASLNPIDQKKWFWKLHFELIPGQGQGFSGISPEATVIVLMDGSILMPSLAEDDSARRQ